MSIIAPFLAFLLVGALAAYHRLRLAYWAAITITALVACWLLGANPAATVVAAVLVALIAIPLLIPGLRKPLVTVTPMEYDEFAQKYSDAYRQSGDDVPDLTEAYAVYCANPGSHFLHKEIK